MHVFRCHRHTQWVAPVMFSPDGRYLAGGRDPLSPSYASVLYVWDTTGAGEPICEWEGYSYGLVFSAAGVLINRGGEVLRLDIHAGKTAPEPALGKFYPVAFSPDGALVLTARTEAESEFVRGKLTLRFTRNTAGTWADVWQQELSVHDEAGYRGYEHLLFSTDGRFVLRVQIVDEEARAQAWTEVQLINAETGNLLVFDRVTPAWRGYLPRPPSKAVAGPGGVLALVKGRTLFAVNPTTPDAKVVKRLNATTKHFTDVAFSSNGTQLATVSRDTAVTMWDTTTWEVQRRYEWKIGPLRSVCFAPDGLRCAAGSETGQVVVWDLDE
jgi:WD40 repeat protein